MIEPIQWDELAEEALHQGKRVMLVEDDGERFWIKRGQLPWDKPDNARAVAVINQEIASIRAIARRGGATPHLAYRGYDYIVLSDLGPSVAEEMARTQDMDVRRELIRRAAQALSRLHAAEGWHGNADLSNLTLMKDGQIGMIDFEDTHRHGWKPLARQAHDVWILMHSAARCERGGLLAREVLVAYRRPGPRRTMFRMALAAAPLYLLLSPVRPMLPPRLAGAVRAVGAILRAGIKWGE